MNWSQQQEHSESQTESANPPAPPPCTSAVSKENAENAERYAYYKSHPKEYFEAAFAPANASNWILAILGIVGGILAGLTLWTIKRQADIQAAGLKQWIDVQVMGSDWDVASRIMLRFNPRRVQVLPLWTELVRDGKTKGDQN